MGLASMTLGYCLTYSDSLIDFYFAVKGRNDLVYQVVKEQKGFGGIIKSIDRQFINLREQENRLMPLPTQSIGFG